MSRYVKADMIGCPCGYCEGYDECQKEVDDAPSIDIVFCVECRECVEKGTGTDCPSGYGYLYCTRKKSVVNEDDYCSWGVRR